MTKVNIIGAGLAGCEAAYQLAKHNIQVNLYEMRSKKTTGAHKTGDFAELVCSNSLRSDALTNAVGVLKNELRLLDSLIMRIADETKIPAGSALAVDRESFAKKVTMAIKSNPNITVINDECTEILEGPTIIASGPLTSEPLSKAITAFLKQGEFYFYDAAAPIIEKDSIDFSKAYYKSRYSDEINGDYINCPMTKEEFYNFYHALITAEVVKPKAFEKEIYFEGCMPFEEIAKRGSKTLLFGPMKPVGLEINGQRPFAVVQLRQDNAVASLYNIVGFQTHLKWGEQKRILQMIPGLENCSIVRYGVMHRNSYINSPMSLKPTYQTKLRDDLFFAGQITGVEGYIESCGSGMVASINMLRYLEKKEPIIFPTNTMLGAMAHYITHASFKNFQPMNANFGIFKLEGTYKKADKKAMYAQQSMAAIAKIKGQMELE